MDDDFDFDEQVEIDEASIKEADARFLENTRQKNSQAVSAECTSRYTMWFLVILLFIFVCFFTWLVVAMIRARRARNLMRFYQFLD